MSIIWGQKKPALFILVLPFNMYNKNKICSYYWIGCNQQKCHVYAFIFNNWIGLLSLSVCTMTNAQASSGSASGGGSDRDTVVT